MTSDEKPIQLLHQRARAGPEQFAARSERRAALSGLGRVLVRVGPLERVPDHPGDLPVSIATALIAIVKD